MLSMPPASNPNQQEDEEWNKRSRRSEEDSSVSHDHHQIPLQISATQPHGGSQQSCRGVVITKTCEDSPKPALPVHPQPPQQPCDNRDPPRGTAAGGKKRRPAMPAEVNDHDYYCEFLGPKKEDEDEEELSSVRSSKRTAGNSHSSVEKRRRDRINTLIDDLAEFVPPANTKYCLMKGPGVRRPKHTILSDTLVLLSNMRKAMESSEQRIATLKAAQGAAAGGPPSCPPTALPPALPSAGLPRPATAGQAAEVKVEVEQEQASMAWEADAAGCGFGAHVQPLRRLVQQQQHGSGSDLRSCGSTGTAEDTSGSPPAAAGGMLDGSAQHIAASMAMFSYDTVDRAAAQDALYPAEDLSDPLTLSAMLLNPGGLCPIGLTQLDAEAQLDTLAASSAQCPMLLALTTHGEEEPEVESNALDWLDWMTHAQPTAPAAAGQMCKVI